MYRDNPVMVYLDENNKKVCRICAYRTILNSENDNDRRMHAHLCSEKTRDYLPVRSNHICCISNPGYLNIRHIKQWKWKFDNTKHKVIMTYDKCKLCNDCNETCLNHIKIIQNLYKQTIPNTIRRKSDI